MADDAQRRWTPDYDLNLFVPAGWWEDVQGDVGETAPVVRGEPVLQGEVVA